MTTLFDPLKLGALELPNRIVMAPLTRSRANDDRVPSALMEEYYRQRASAGLILSEATSVTPMGVGYANTPGIWSDEQVAAWKRITDSVHAAGGRIVMQLWHVGRVSHSSFLNGETPVAPSAIAAPGHVRRVRPETPHPTPRALALDELPGVIADYRKGAENAKRAGFDGVEVHGANGYLLDQFLQSSANQRDDRYGGSVENRARLLLEVTDACIEVWGADRVGVHLAPRGDLNTIEDDTPEQTFGYVAEQLDKRQIAFIFTREFVGKDSVTPLIRQKFNGPLIANEQLDRENAEALLERGEADAVSFGELFIANPDLVERLHHHGPYNTPDTGTFYDGGSKGYTDYPTLDA
ncbi:alkene reductase [Carnimonas nigrificans]|uniref:alkene reductase n=1 Tax=Carnimonas nigrificans TaxID=64323 RepID=UPI00047033A2|nr:alkene reductase [Carnimonas nigrificans]